MTSPSISSTRRSTPCAAGCCGPKFSVKFWISGIAARILQVFLVAVVAADHLRHERPRLYAHWLIDDAALHGVVAHLDVPYQREILAERMADEAVVREEPAQIRVTPEQDAVKVECLTLVPVRRVPNRVHRI